MLHFCSYGGLRVLSAFSGILSAFAEFLDLRWPTIELVPDLFALFVAHNVISTLICPEVAAVSIDGLFFACQQLWSHDHIVGIGRSDNHRVSKTAILIHADVGLIAKVLRVALLCLMDIRVTLFLLVFGGGRRRNNGRINYGSFFEDQSPFLE